MKVYSSVSIWTKYIDLYEILEEIGINWNIRYIRQNRRDWTYEKPNHVICLKFDVPKQIWIITNNYEHIQDSVQDHDFTKNW